MNVFVTGSTGYIGQAIVRTLVRAGHRVTGLARSAEKAEETKRLGATVLMGDVHDAALLREQARRHDATIHAAFEFSADGAAVDKEATEAILEGALSGPPRVFVYTSGVWVLGNTGGHEADESFPTTGALPLVAWRPAHEQMVLGNTEGVSTAVLRPGLVWGGRAGLMARYFDSATKEGAAVYIGDGSNRSGLVHLDDLAELYRLIIEKKATGIFHGADGVTLRTAEIAEAASRAAGKGGATRGIPLDEARKTMGAFADALCVDQIVAAKRSRELGWKPQRRSFVLESDAAYREWRGE